MKSSAELSLDTSVSLILAYGGEAVASYEFTSLQDANSFILKVKELSDQEKGVKVRANIALSVTAPI